MNFINGIGFAIGFLVVVIWFILRTLALLSILIYLLPLLIPASIVSKSLEPFKYFLNRRAIVKNYSSYTLDDDIKKEFDLRSTGGKNKAALAQAKRDIKEDMNHVAKNFRILRSTDKEIHLIACSKEDLKIKHLVNNDTEFEDINFQEIKGKYQSGKNKEN